MAGGKKDWDGKGGTTKPPAHADTPKAIQKCKPNYPYFKYKHDRKKQKWYSTEGDGSKGDPGAMFGYESEGATGERVNDRQVREQRHSNSLFQYTYGVIMDTSNAARGTSSYGTKHDLYGDKVSHARVVDGGGYKPDNQGEPAYGLMKVSHDRAGAKVTGGDVGGYLSGSFFGIGAREVAIKSGGNAIIHSTKGALAVLSKTNYLSGSSTGCASIGGNGLTLAGNKQLSIGSGGPISIYSESNIIWAPDGVFINCFKGPDNAATLKATGRPGTPFVPGAKSKIPTPAGIVPWGSSGNPGNA